jgi:hypothetical protein
MLLAGPWTRYTTPLASTMRCLQFRVLASHQQAGWVATARLANRWGR